MTGLIDDYLKTYVAKVWVEINDQDFQVGTGMLLSKRWVISAKHVIEIEDKIEEDKIRVGFPEAKNKGFSGFKNPMLVHKVYSFENSDVVFIELDADLPVSSFLLQLGRKFSDSFQGEQWKGCGYPKYSKEFSETCEDIAGEFHLTPQNNPKVQVESSYFVNDPEELKGASGSVVVRNGMIYGVIEKITPEIKNKFYIDSLPYLFKCSDEFNSFFQDNLSLSESRAVLVKVCKTSLESKLCETESFIESLKGYLKCGSFFSVDFFGWLLDSFTPLDILDQLIQFLEEHRGLFDDKSASKWNEWVDAAEYLGKWVLLFSVKPEFNLKSDNLWHDLDLEEPLFGEVVVSRQLIKCPGFIIENGFLGFDHPSISSDIYDANAIKVSIKSFLTYLFVDLRPTATLESANSLDVSDLIRRIKLSVEGKVRRAIKEKVIEAQKFVYYFVDETSIDLVNLEPINTMVSDLRGKLQFVTVPENAGTHDASEEGDGSLLTALSDIMNMKNFDVIEGS